MTTFDDILNNNGCEISSNIQFQKSKDIDS